MFKVCSFAGCEEVSLPDSPHCSEHAADAATKLAARRAAAQKSDQAQLGRKLYSLPRWKREAHAFLTRNPLCVDCLDLGAVVPATDVDHMLPHRGNRQRFFDRSNWQALCHPCHSRKTAHEVFHSGVPGVGK